MLSTRFRRGPIVSKYGHCIVITSIRVRTTANDENQNRISHMTSKATPEKVESLRNELNQIRQASLNATRNGDFMRVARLTPRAAQINKAIMDAEAQMLADL